MNPTCPRCGDLCPHDSRYCAMCGCALRLTVADYRTLRELREPPALLPALRVV